MIFESNWRQQFERMELMQIDEESVSDVDFPSLDTSFADVSENYTEGLDELLSELLEDESTPSSTSTTLSKVGNDLAITLPPKRKRKNTKRPSNNPAFNPQIRIFRRDIRRKYALMLSNVMNSRDSLLLSQFLKEFAVPHFEAHEEIPEDVDLKLHRMKIIQGQDQFVEVIGYNFAMMPDGIFCLSDVKVCQKLNTLGSRVVLRASMLGTMVFEVKKSNQHRTLTSGEEMKASPYYQKDIHPSNSLQLVNKPYEYSLDLIITMQLDSDHRFISFTLNVQNTKERYLD